MTVVSASPTIHSLIVEILAHQPELNLGLFESMKEMTLDENPEVSILGPNKTFARHFNSKMVQFAEMTGIVPLVEGEICQAESTANRDDPIFQ